VWPCSYDHRELACAIPPGQAEAGHYRDETAQKLKDQKLIFNNSIFCTRSLFRIHIARRVHKKYGQAARLISTSQLKASLLLHIWPIDLVIFQESLGALWLGRSHLVEGFTLRCIQRFSLPDVATRRCHWRDNRYTRGPSNPVLSY
jgi:hypothetical protein